MRTTAILSGAVILSCVTLLSVTEAKSIADAGTSIERNGLDNTLSGDCECTKDECTCCGEGPNSTVCSSVTVMKLCKENRECFNALIIEVTIDGVHVFGGIFQGSEDFEGICEGKGFGVYLKLTVSKGMKRSEACGSLQLATSKDRLYQFEDFCITVPPANTGIDGEESYAALGNQVRVHLRKLKAENRHSSQEHEDSRLETRLGSIFPDNPFIPFIPWSA